MSNGCFRRVRSPQVVAGNFIHFIISLSRLLGAVIAVLMISRPSFSQSQTFVRDYTYTADQGESKEDAETVALYEVKKRLLEEVGTYISTTLEMTKIETPNGVRDLTKENVVSISAGVTQTKILEEKWTGESYYLKVAVTIDPADVKEKLRALLDIRGMAVAMEDMKKRADEAVAEIQQLKRELASGETEGNTAVVRSSYQGAIRTLNYAELFQRATNYQAAKSSSEAARLYSEAININPGNYLAYFARALSRYQSGDYRGTLSDCAIVTRLNPNYPQVYLIRGYAEWNIKNYSGGTADLTTYLRMVPNDLDVYVVRATIKYLANDFRGGIDDCSKAIQINPNYANAYAARGVGYARLGYADAACRDYKMAMRLGATGFNLNALMSKVCR